MFPVLFLVSSAFTLMFYTLQQTTSVELPSYSASSLQRDIQILHFALEQDPTIQDKDSATTELNQQIEAQTNQNLTHQIFPGSLDANAKVRTYQFKLDDNLVASITDEIPIGKAINRRRTEQLGISQRIYNLIEFEQSVACASITEQCDYVQAICNVGCVNCTLSCQHLGTSNFTNINQIDFFKDYDDVHQYTVSNDESVIILSAIINSNITLKQYVSTKPQ